MKEDVNVKDNDERNEERLDI